MYCVLIAWSRWLAISAVAQPPARATGRPAGGPYARGASGAGLAAVGPIGRQARQAARGRRTAQGGLGVGAAKRASRPSQAGSRSSVRKLETGRLSFKLKHVGDDPRISGSLLAQDGRVLSGNARRQGADRKRACLLCQRSKEGDQSGPSAAQRAAKVRRGPASYARHIVYRVSRKKENEAGRVLRRAEVVSGARCATCWPANRLRTLLPSVLASLCPLRREVGTAAVGASARFQKWRRYRSLAHARATW
jgi:hypothetical protein